MSDEFNPSSGLLDTSAPIVIPESKLKLSKMSLAIKAAQKAHECLTSIEGFPFVLISLSHRGGSELHAEGNYGGTRDPLAGNAYVATARSGQRGSIAQFDAQATYQTAVVEVWKHTSPDLMRELIVQHGPDNPLGPVMERLRGVDLIQFVKGTLQKLKRTFGTLEDVDELVRLHREGLMAGWATRHVPDTAVWLSAALRSPAITGLYASTEHARTLAGAVGSAAPLSLTDFANFKPPEGSLVKSVTIRPPATLRITLHEPHRPNLIQMNGIIYEVDPSILADFSFRVVDVNVKEPTKGFPNSVAWWDEAATQVAKHPNIGVGNGRICLGTMAGNESSEGGEVVKLSEFLQGMSMLNLDSSYFREFHVIFPKVDEEVIKRAQKKGLAEIPGVRLLMAPNVEEWFK